MKISETRPIGPARSVTARTAYGKSASASADTSGRQADVTSILGIPEEELTEKVQSAISRLMSEVERLRHELDDSHKRVAYFESLADEDTLVPVINRRAFVRELSRMMSYVERYGSPHSVLFFDIDGLKAINDTYGHAAGDKALKHAANVLLESVRESDIVGRLGGDEFGVILAQADKTLANDKAEILADAIRATPFEWEGQKMNLSVAYGAYTMTGGEDADAALHAADRAMYAQKRRNVGS